MTKIAIILGSTRPGRKAEIVGRWVHAHAAARNDATFEIVDLADYDLPHLDEAKPPIMGAYEQPHTKAWAATIAAYDGYVFVTPEYNHSTSGALKNAIDSSSPSGTTKPAPSSATASEAANAPSSTYA